MQGLPSLRIFVFNIKNWQQGERIQVSSVFSLDSGEINRVNGINFRKNFNFVESLIDNIYIL